MKKIKTDSMNWGKANPIHTYYSIFLQVKKCSHAGIQEEYNERQLRISSEFKEFTKMIMNWGRGVNPIHTYYNISVQVKKSSHAGIQEEENVCQL